MLTRHQLQRDLIANPKFLSIVQAVTFNGQRVSIDEVIDWAHSNWAEFADIAGIEEEAKPVRASVTSAQGRTLKAELIETLGQSVSVRKRGKYSFSVTALSMSDSEIRDALNASQCTIVKTVSGLFGTAGIRANDLEYIVTI
tara:strand:+ start:112 stop:537 length:426 start_codon:yes stop_codon:yes gene_type:complete